MKRKLATLEVWAEDGSEEPSDLDFNLLTKHGKLTLRVPGDPHAPLRTKNDMADVLAHELGHFIGHALEVGSHAMNQIDSMAYFFGGITPRVYQSEKQAWDFAEKMRKINPTMRDNSLATYEQSLIGV